VRIALKEWATVIRALAQGEQIFILRKGGLAETRRGFELAHPKFVFFPTWEHQQREQLDAPYQTWFDELEPREPSKLTISAIAEEVETLEAPAERERWHAARGLHVWNDSYIDMRYDYRPDLPLRLVLLRASVLPKPVEIPADRRYGGCRSWVDLYDDVSVAGARPALADENFQQAKKQLCNALGLDLKAKPD